MPAHARSMQTASLDAQPPAPGMGVHDRLGKRDNRLTSVLLIDGEEIRAVEFHGLPHDAHATLMRFLRDFVNYKSRSIKTLDSLVLMTMMHSKKYDEENLKSLLAFINQTQAFDVVSTIFKNMNISEPERSGMFVTKVVVFMDQA